MSDKNTEVAAAEPTRNTTLVTAEPTKNTTLATAEPTRNVAGVSTTDSKDLIKQIINSPESNSSKYGGFKFYHQYQAAMDVRTTTKMLSDLTLVENKMREMKQLLDRTIDAATDFENMRRSLNNLWYQFEKIRTPQSSVGSQRSLSFVIRNRTICSSIMFLEFATIDLNDYRNPKLLKVLRWMSEYPWPATHELGSGEGITLMENWAKTHNARQGHYENPIHVHISQSKTSPIGQIYVIRELGFESEPDPPAAGSIPTTTSATTSPTKTAT